MRAQDNLVGTLSQQGALTIKGSLDGGEENPFEVPLQDDGTAIVEITTGSDGSLPLGIFSVDEQKATKISE